VEQEIEFVVLIMFGYWKNIFEIALGHIDGSYL
jgi:hypothetical protein